MKLAYTIIHCPSRRRPSPLPRIVMLACIAGVALTLIAFAVGVV